MAIRLNRKTLSVLLLLAVVAVELCGSRIGPSRPKNPPGMTLSRKQRPAVTACDYG